MKILLSNDTKYVLALSGGSDSIALLNILVENQYDFRVVHVNHKQHELDDVWEKFIRDNVQPKYSGVSFTYLYADCVVKGKGAEAAARVARYEELSANINDDEILLTGHHADDCVETVLHNIFRGCGVSGAVGIRRESIVWNTRVIRPLVSYTKSEVNQYCVVNQLKYIDDETNSDDSITRNFIRRHVIPTILLRFTGLRENVIRFSHRCQEADELMRDLYLIDKEKFNRMNYYRPEGFFSLREIKTLSDVRLRNLLYWYLKEECNITLSENGMSEVVKFINSDRSKKEKHVIKVSGVEFSRDSDIFHIATR